MNIATGKVTQLSLPINSDVVSGYDYLPTVSPDGTQVSFTREIDTETTYTEDIAVMPIAGETATSAATLLTAKLPTAGTSFEPMYLDNGITKHRLPELGAQHRNHRRPGYVRSQHLRNEP